MTYTPELLAPCGEYNSAIAAFSAGADAIYLGADAFSARAYAKNLSTDQIVDVIKYGHILGKKIYLALNILLKNTEMYDALKLIEPLYQAGLDGIIIQDLGLIDLLSNTFPKVELHGSTQMSVMSSEGGLYLKDKGIKRIVPSRELSLSEFKHLKDAGLEVECFIHGAMCYSYSGKCLFSSMAGGRSGNRGRCAGTCRKSYSLYEDGNSKKLMDDAYIISMKDMCTLEDIGALIDAGIDSFKIEGRMKSPEYAAGVTAIYRKYIDLYLKNGSYKVSKEDLEEISDLYIRSQICQGYMNTHNGKSMISIESPSYKGISKEKAKEIADKYIENRIKKDIKLDVFAFVDSRVKIKVTYGKDLSLDFEGPICQEAQNKALSEKDIKDKLSKFGNTPYNPVSIKVKTDDRSFIPVSVLNECRRNICDLLEDKLITVNKDTDTSYFDKKKALINNKSSKASENSYIVAVKNIGQLKAVLEYDFYSKLILDCFILGKLNKNLVSKLMDKEVYISLPPVMRDNKISYIKTYLDKEISNLLDDGIVIKGIYAGSIDAIAFAKKYYPEYEICGDTGLYVFNIYSEDYVLDMVSSYTSSYENNFGELKHYNREDKREVVIYGYTELMQTANCLLKTSRGCNKDYEKILYLEDDKGRKFPALLNHNLCFNTIYNNLPQSLMDNTSELSGRFSGLRFNFTIEDYNETKNILVSFETGNINNSYTRGHYNRGVE